MSSRQQGAPLVPVHLSSPVSKRELKCQLGGEGGPSGWDATPGQHQASMRYLDVVGLRVKYKGPGSDDRDAASIRSNNPIPKGCPVYYFEVEIINKGRDGYIGIGLSRKDVKLDRLPGWEPHSYGYHGDDGHVFNGRGTGRPYGPIFTTGDWVGIIYNRIEKTLTFTKKGFQLGVAFRDVEEEILYPTVGFRTPDEEVAVNFGDDLERRPFKGDYEAILESVMSNLYTQILDTKIPGSSDIIAELVFDYLKHHGYWETAQAVGEDVLKGRKQISQTTKEESMALYAATEYVMGGDIDKAMASAEELCPGVLDENPSIAFALKCQKLCELIRDKKDEDAMEYGRQELTQSCSTSEDRVLMEKVLTLFAYSDPASSPFGDLLSTAYKTELAASLARALRKHLGKREVSTLEEMYRQTCVLGELLHQMEDPAAALINVRTFVDEKGG